MIVTIFNTEVNLLAQFFGFIMLIFVIISYQMKDNKYYVYMSVAFALCALESITLGSVSNFICCLVSICRNMTVLYFRRRDRDVPNWATVALILPIAATGVYAALHWPWYQLMPPILIITLTLLAVQRSIFVLKFGSIFIELGLLVFNLFIGAYVGVLRQAIATTSVVVGLVSYIRALRRGEVQDHLPIINNQTNKKTK